MTPLKRRALILFTRLPIPGKTKTRMMPALTPDACAELQWALLDDLAPVLQRAEGDLFVFYTPDDHPSELERLRALMPSAVFLVQRGEGLGSRMDRAFALIFERGYDGCLLLGSDIPLIDAGDIEAAWRELQGHDVVLAPCEDGGYWFVGLKAPFPALFTGQTYGTDGVMEQARRTCAAEGRSLGYGARKRDLDVIEGLRFFQRTLTADQAPCLWTSLASGLSLAVMRPDEPD